ncbi:non-specific lipid-transfer protein 1-like [Solanum dulcamara]|uniref:non-specific lipid-transfer protein 1-like n=1 Tax=Solanum dulcamara TaxID=45834 RepID=UPI0024863DC3|nr:non-specific lipid-transfer protein 1-like [Solanum dulcamara]
MAFSQMQKVSAFCFLLCMVIISPHAEAAISCNTVYSKLMPCLSYLMGGSNKEGAPAGCCSGIQSLYTAASTTAERQGVCSCLKSGAASLGSSIDTNKAATLLSKCGVTVPYKISPNIDCSKIQ